LKSTQLKVECSPGQICPELEFVLSYVFEDRLGLGPVELCEGLSGTIYTVSLGDALNVCLPSSEYFAGLATGDRVHSKPEVLGNGADARIFPVINPVSEKDCLFDFDLFAAIFYMLTRVEEFDFVTTDAHGRFVTSNSWMHEAGCLEIPIIDVWIQRLGNFLQERGVRVKKEAYEWWNTIDIDQLYATKGKPALIRFGQVIRSLLNLKWTEAGLLLSTFISEDDPYDVEHLLHVDGARNVCFLLLNDDSTYDPSYNKDQGSIRSFVKRYEGDFEIGLHPSYDSSQKPDTLSREIRDGKNWIGADLSMSRQHYLKLKWPKTMEQLVQHEMQFEFSMGFPDALGFRAGTSRPFPFFDRRKRSKTGLSIVPFCVMDVTLRYYLKLNPEEAIARIESLIDTTRKYNGIFVSLWHNESYGEINGWKPWKEVFDQMKKLALK